MNYNYASLGNSCQVSSDVLLNNTKYFPPNFSLYNVYITKMMNYPAESNSDVCNKKSESSSSVQNSVRGIVSPTGDTPEDPPKETFIPYRSQVNHSQSCCGRK